MFFPAGMAQQPPQQQQHQQRTRTDEQVAKVRELVSGPLKAKWQETLRHASDKINNTTVIAAATGASVPPNNNTRLVFFKAAVLNWFSNDEALT